MEKLSKNLVSAVLLITAIFVFSSCNDELDQIDKDVQNSVEESTIVDGRLNFNSSESLKSRIEDLKSKSEEVLVDELEKLNNAGFRSLRPIVTESNFESVQQRYGTLTNGRTIDEAQEVTDYIGDDVFAAILNEEGLLQVGDSVYKYTPIGLFFVHESKLDHLNNFLEELLGSQNNARSLQPIDPCPILADYNVQGGEVTSLDSDINYYSAIDPCSGGGGGSPYPNPTPSPSPSVDTGEEFISNLSPCQHSEGWWPFGDSYKCDDNFTDRSRVRTKFWNQNYIIFKSIGVEVKHQHRQFGIWYRSKIDEMRLGIRSAYFDYSQSAINNNPPVKSLIRNGLSYDFMGQSIPINGSVPEFPFSADLFSYIKLPTGNDHLITPDHVNSVLLEEAIDAAKSVFGTHSTDDILLMVEGDYKQSMVFVDLSNKSTNVNKISKVFDWNFLVTVTLGFSNSGGLTMTQPPIFGAIADYDNSKIEAYGIGRRNTDWKGSLLIVEEN